MVGILTSKDIKFSDNFNSATKIREIMTTNLVTAKEGVDFKEAFEIMNKHKVGKLPIINREGKLAGLYSFHDLKALNSEEKNDVNFDSHYQLRVACCNKLL